MERHLLYMGVLRTIKVSDSEMIQVVPQCLRDDPETKALSYAISRQFYKIITGAKYAGVYAIIDILPEKAVDLLAVEFRTQYYDVGLPLVTKREAVKNTLLWYYRAGTPAAVKELTKVAWMSDNVEVQEWFQYGGAPYLFKIMLSSSLSFDEAVLDRFFSSINQVKNARSHLESIQVVRVAEQKLFIGAGARYSTKSVIVDVFTDTYKRDTELISGGAAHHKSIRLKIREE